MFAPPVRWRPTSTGSVPPTQTFFTLPGVFMTITYTPAYAVFKSARGFLPVVVWQFGQRLDLDVRPTERDALLAIAEELERYGFALDCCERLC